VAFVDLALNQDVTNIDKALISPCGVFVLDSCPFIIC